MNDHEDKLKIVYSQTDIIQAHPTRGISDILKTYDITKQAVRKYNDESNSDKVEISKLSEPYKEFFRVQECYTKETWNEIKDKFERITDGDYFFVYRANYELTFFDYKNVYDKEATPVGSPYWYWFQQYFSKLCDESENYPPASLWDFEHDWMIWNRLRAEMRLKIQFESDSKEYFEPEIEDSEVDKALDNYKKRLKENEGKFKEGW